MDFIKRERHSELGHKILPHMTYVKLRRSGEMQLQSCYGFQVAVSSKKPVEPRDLFDGIDCSYIKRRRGKI